MAICIIGIGDAALKALTVDAGHFGSTHGVGVSVMLHSLVCQGDGRLGGVDFDGNGADHRVVTLLGHPVADLVGTRIGVGGDGTLNVIAGGTLPIADGGALGNGDRQAHALAVIGLFTAHDTN